MKTDIKFFPLCCLVSLLLAGVSRANDSERNPRTVYFTVGDSQMLPWTPLDSKTSIDLVFDALHDQDHISRVWWRGGQDEVWGEEFLLREQNREYTRVWNWWRDLQYRKVGTNRIAVKAAHARGMEIWMAYGLFDNGSSPDVGFYGFPYAAEDKIRVEHPEWAPINRYGTWRQGGPIEFCYPGARKAMVDYLTKYVVESKAVIQQLMQQKEDRQLADLAWRIVYLEQVDGSTPSHMKIPSVSEKEDLAAHLKHPFLNSKSARPSSGICPP